MSALSLAEDGDGDAVCRHADQRHDRQPHALRGERIRRQQRRPLLRGEDKKHVSIASLRHFTNKLRQSRMHPRPCDVNYADDF